MSSRMVFRISVLILAIAATARAQEAPAGYEEAAKLFGPKGKGCSSCHTIGQGDKTGPNLKGVTQRRDEAWVKRFINAPVDIIKSGDVTAVELFKKFGGVLMAPQGLSDEEFGKLWAYWKHCDLLSDVCYKDPRWGTDATPQEVADGEALFMGAKALENGGPSCFGCHNVRGISLWGGGSVGPDLTFGYARLGENNLVLALEEMSSPVMKTLYEKAPLTPSEQYQVRAFLADVARDGTLPEPAETNLLYLGLEGMGMVVGLALILWNRKRGNS